MATTAIPVITLFHTRENAPSGLAESDVAVIDVLRATTSVCAVLGAGASEVIPFASIEDALAAKKKISSPPLSIKTLIAGEEGGKKIPGFDAGNSPVEFSGMDLRDYTVILRTTNGTYAIEKLAAAAVMYTVSPVNLNATIKALTVSDRPLVVCAAGKEGIPCYEDIICAGALLSGLSRHKTLDLDDTSLIAIDTYDKNVCDLKSAFMGAEHGRYLDSLGFGSDIIFAAELNRYDFAVIRNVGGRLVRLNDK